MKWVKKILRFFFTVNKSIVWQYRTLWRIWCPLSLFIPTENVRKTLVFFSSGYKNKPEAWNRLTATTQHLGSLRINRHQLLMFPNHSNLEPPNYTFMRVPASIISVDGRSSYSQSPPIVVQSISKLNPAGSTKINQMLLESWGLVQPVIYKNFKDIHWENVPSNKTLPPAKSIYMNNWVVATLNH